MINKFFQFIVYIVVVVVVSLVCFELSLDYVVVGILYFASLCLGISGMLYAGIWHSCMLVWW